MESGFRRYPVAGLITLALIAFFAGATFEDFRTDAGEWIFKFQTLIAAGVAVPTIFAAFRQIEANRQDRQADRRFQLAPRIDAVEEVRAYAEATSMQLSTKLISALLRRTPVAPGDILLRQADAAGPEISQKLQRLQGLFDGTVVPTTGFVPFIGVISLLGWSAKEAAIHTTCVELIKVCDDRLAAIELMISGHLHPPTPRRK